eukprot:TRINITY_DN35164_c0_g1_i1.p1 TRINITY_DN35164_c0_g1~~TRINITY_DN35164_c0_g1_i1.p1  ORF type:complete len:320 (+),score=30.33 TRINITY_DN35164_c0_g1_i1:27-962(+)
MAVVNPADRTNWELFAVTKHVDRTSLTRPRKLLTSQSLLQYRKSNRAQEAKHPEEYRQTNWLLANPPDDAIVLSRIRQGCTWKACGAALRVCKGKTSESRSPTVFNCSRDCLDRSSAYPEFSAIGARPLQPGLVNRITFEVESDDSAEQARIAQVGIAQVAPGPELDKNTRYAIGQSLRGVELLENEQRPLLASVLFTGAGDIISAGTAGDIEIISPGSSALRQRTNDWWSGGPTWLLSPAVEKVQLMLEVDFSRGTLSLRRGGWFEDPLVISLEGVLSEVGVGQPWVPVVSLTGIGQQARLIDVHVVSDH